MTQMGMQWQPTGSFGRSASASNLMMPGVCCILSSGSSSMTSWGACVSCYACMLELLCLQVHVSQATEGFLTEHRLQVEFDMLLMPPCIVIMFLRMAVMQKDDRHMYDCHITVHSTMSGLSTEHHMAYSKSSMYRCSAAIDDSHVSRTFRTYCFPEANVQDAVSWYNHMTHTQQCSHYVCVLQPRRRVNRTNLCNCHDAA